MADVRPFNALLYDPSVAGAASDLVAPPYDVVSPADSAALYARSPYNIARVDYGEELPGDTDASNRYTRARKSIEAWLRDGALKRDAKARIYVYDQEFKLDGETKRRRAVFARLRLEEWEKGIVLPHEVTGAGAKEDRLRLLRAARVHLSPIMALYQSEGAVIADADLEAPVLDAVLPKERHTLRPVRAEAAEPFLRDLAAQRLYVADGHHRYETGLNYRNERRAAAERWTGEEPENFILAALVDAADPGLVVLPTHRLLKLPQREPRLSLRRLVAAFDLEDSGVANDTNLDHLMRQLSEAGARGNAFGAIGLEPGRLHLLTPRDSQAVIARTPSDRSPEWRRLDVAVLQYAVLPAIDFVETPETIAYSEDHRHAARAVAEGGWDVAFLLNPTPVDQVIAVAETGDRMPRKSTFFYPKLATGVVMLPVD